MEQVIYQLAWRTFTPEGTIAAASELLEHVASLGVDIVYVCPFYVQDDEMDLSAWSPRQKASNTGNPKNPYKIKDYFHVDEEYGTEEDLKHFVKKAHEAGLKVIFDLVYLHCGKNAVFIAEHPDWVEREADGTAAVGEEWPFARLNFKNDGLREYLYENMEYYVREFDIDGYRCDVGDRVPLDFWREAFRRVKQIRSDLMTLNEGVEPEYIQEVFDWGYNFPWRNVFEAVFRGVQPAAALRERFAEENAIYGKNVNKLMRCLDNHDTASDCGLVRNEIEMTSDGVEAALVMLETYPGVPVLWNGYEVCNNMENNMFSNRDYGRRNFINWSRGFTARGQARMRFMRELHALRKQHPALTVGDFAWLPEEEILAFIRTAGDETVQVFINCTFHDAAVSFPAGEMLFSAGVTETGLAAHGYCIVKTA